MVEYILLHRILLTGNTYILRIPSRCHLSAIQCAYSHVHSSYGSFPRNENTIKWLKEARLDF